MSDRIEAEILDVLGEEVAAAVDTPLVVIEGPKGEPGKNGITPTIGDNGNWYLGEEDTGKPSRGETGPQGTPGIYYGTTQPTGDTHPVWIDPDGDHDDGGLLPAVTAADNGKVLRVAGGAWAPVDMPTGGTDMGITGATVGQIAKITAVDGTGKPTAWSPVDMPSGGSMRWQKIKEITLAEQTNDIVIGEDDNGVSVANYNPIAMKVEFHVPADSTQTNANGAPWIYPSATCNDNGIRVIGSIAAWKTVSRRQVAFFIGDIDGIFAGGNFNTQLVPDPSIQPNITVMDGVKLHINGTGDHWPVGTIVSLEVLSERA